jgi:DNA-binding transcriptional MerR regulator
MLTIGEVAARSGVGVPTIRYYERIGLIPPATRTAGGQRRYDTRGAERLAFVRQARALGLPLDAVRALLDLEAHPDRPCAQADRIVRMQLSEVRGRIARLRRLEAELARMTDRCEGGRAGDCTVIAALAGPAGGREGS